MHQLLSKPMILISKKPSHILKYTTVFYSISEASALIIGAPDLHIRAGSLLTIKCVLRQSTEQPLYVFWFHETHMINHDPGVSVINDRSSSTLQLEEADKSHSGNYTCSPSNAIPAHVNVHVLNATDGNVTHDVLHVCAYIYFSFKVRCGALFVNNVSVRMRC